MDDSRSSTQAEIEHAAAFRAELRRFLARTETAAAEAGLTQQRYDLLLAIKAAGGQATINELCSYLQMRQTAVTELVKRAEEAGLAVRTPSTIDRRVVLVSITDEAEARFKRGFDALRADHTALAELLDLLKATFETRPALELAESLHPALEPPTGAASGFEPPPAA
ncbi:MAG TPA: MarR family transcriptional regulator [Gaiellaceae bacterium]|nr:MarR family transcriptional regulator [Gaiellaceae bacterium]